MKLVSKKTLVQRYQAPGWQHRAAMYKLDPYMDEDNFCESLRRARLYVPNDHAQSPRVAKAIKFVWLGMPFPARARLMRYWRAMIRKVTLQDLDVLLPGLPIIEITDNFHATASTSAGIQIGFNGQVIAAMQDEVLQDVVAHEFGHAWSYTFPDSMMRLYSSDLH